MNKIGLKLYTTNMGYFREIIRLYKLKVFDYIELYVVPYDNDDLFDSNFRYWFNIKHELNIPFVIHCAHSMHGFNLSEIDFNNYLIFSEAVEYYEMLESDKMIIHPGVSGDIEITIKSINSLKSLFPHVNLLVENKPSFTLTDDICIGSCPYEISKIINECEIGFVLDIGHAVKYAIDKNTNHICILEIFKTLEPDMIHVSDVKLDVKYDEHLHIGDGDLDFNEILDMFQCDITVETLKDSMDDLMDFEKDVKCLKN
jgi:deoxyribonuclease IV